MKKQLVARGIAGALSLCGVLGLVGCGAEMGDQGAAGEGEIGSTEQAVTVGISGTDLAFGGFTKINGVNKALWAGGHTLGGVVSNKLFIFDPAGPTFASLKQAANTALDLTLPTALTEPEVAPIPGQTHKYLVAGGRTAVDGATTTLSYVVTLDANGNGNLNEATVSAAINMNQSRQIGVGNLQPCGSGSRLIAIGGTQNNGFNMNTGMTARDTIEVFDFNGGAPVWTNLVQTVAGVDRQVKLQVDRGYHNVLHVSNTDFVIAGGANNANSRAIPSAPLGAGSKNVEKLTVDSSCKATSAINLGSVSVPDMRTQFTANDMPSPRARAAALPKSIQPNGAGTTYEFVVSRGNQNAVNPFTVHTDAVLYDTATEAWTTICAGNITGAIYPRATDSGTSAKFATGVIPQAANPFALFRDTTAVVDVISNVGGCSTATALTDSRVGAFLLDLGGTQYTGEGFKYVGGVGSSSLLIESL